MWFTKSQASRRSIVINGRNRTAEGLGRNRWGRGELKGDGGFGQRAGHCCEEGLVVVCERSSPPPHPSHVAKWKEKNTQNGARDPTHKDCWFAIGPIRNKPVVTPESSPIAACLVFSCAPCTDQTRQMVLYSTSFFEFFVLRACCDVFQCLLVCGSWDDCPQN